MTAVSTFRKELEDAVLERHCAHHPMTQKWAAGELSRNCLMGWGIEQYHWISNLVPEMFFKMAKAPAEARGPLFANFMEEYDPDRPHLDIILRFAAANGADVEAVKRGRGLPTTEAWVAFMTRVAKDEPWIAGIACQMIGTESQSPLLYSTVLPALREKYQFPEDAIEHFWLHNEADVEHGDRGFQILEKYCTTQELRDVAIHWARESARMRWFYFDGIYLHYELGYKLR
jgi:pyrroloquinoline-quinone synthase